MRERDFKRFSQSWAAAWDLAGKQITPGAIHLAFAALAMFELPDIEIALTAHIRDPNAGQYAPKPADIIRHLTPPVSADGRPDANEAWALCPRNEHVTVVWTKEMSSAWGIAQPLMAEGDVTAARMAFREAYDRLLEAARKERIPARWTVSLGHDKHGRESAIMMAVERGRLTAAHAQRLLPAVVNPMLLEFVRLGNAVSATRAVAHEHETC